MKARKFCIKPAEFTFCHQFLVLILSKTLNFFRMKFFIILIFGLVAISGSSAQTGSAKIQNEVDAFLKTFTTTVTSQVNSIISAVHTRAGQYYSAYQSLKDRIGTALSALGSQGQQIAQQINSEADKLIESLHDLYSSANLQTKVNQTLAFIKSNYLDPIQKHIDTLKTAVDVNPKSIKCWENSKNDLSDILNSAASDLGSVINKDLATVDSKAKALAKKIEDAVNRIENEVKAKCGSSGSCYVQYVKLSFHQ